MQRKNYLYSDLLGKGGSKEGLFSKEWSRGISINDTVRERSEIKMFY